MTESQWLNGLWFAEAEYVRYSLKLNIIQRKREHCQRVSDFLPRKQVTHSTTYFSNVFNFLIKITSEQQVQFVKRTSKTDSTKAWSCHACSAWTPSKPITSDRIFQNFQGTTHYKWKKMCWKTVRRTVSTSTMSCSQQPLDRIIIKAIKKEILKKF